ncbi:MAG TPA: hypothetical protein VHF45_04690 [Thermoleophilaceae bacterium]|nr:hypothetical protein [Thermoleophilaceae bacterium]
MSRRIRIDRSGEHSTFVMERPSDGGVYRAGRRLSFAGFEFPGSCVLDPS